jgi:hypothetical protein
MTRAHRQLRHALHALALTCAMAAASTVAAQVPDLGRLSTPVRFSGEVGSYGELYTINGREQRRPSSAAPAGITGRVTGGNGSCMQRFVKREACPEAQRIEDIKEAS